MIMAQKNTHKISLLGRYNFKRGFDANRLIIHSKTTKCFIDSEEAHINITSLKEAGIVVKDNNEYDKLFHFHIQIA
jgi:hypothetical protein